MNLASFLELAQNAALLLALALIFELAAARRQRAVSTLSGIVAGIALGLIGIVIMCTPWFLEPGIRFDMRTVLVSLSGLFFGWLPSVIVMASLAAFRWYLGGVGSGTAMAIILLSGVLGLAWRRLRRHRLAEISFREGFLFGLIVHALALLSMLTLPWETALRVLSSITLPFLTVHPLATALLGTLMAGRLQREETLARLRESEDRYRSLFENSMDAILLTVTDGHILDANPAACRMFGRAREDILAVGRSGLVDTTDPRLAALLEERERSGTASGRLSHFRKDGTRFTAELTTSLFPDTEGKMKTSMILRDITEREKTEKALQESERLFRTLTENTPDIVARFDRNLRHVYINPVIEKMTGRPQSDFLGKTNQELGMPEENLRRWNEALLQAFETGKTVHMEFDFTSLAGTRYFTSTLVPEFDDFETVASVLSLVHDITDPKRTREALRTAGLYARSLIEASLDPLATIGADGIIRDVNAATEKITGCSRQELIGSDFCGYFTDSEQARSGYQKAFLEGEVHDYPLEIRHRDGHTVPVSYNATVYRDESGMIAGVFAAARDMTQIRQAEKKLHQQTETLRELSNRLATTEETERRRLAEALHDLVGQDLTALGIDLQIIRDSLPADTAESLAPRLNETQALLQDTIENIRNVITELRPDVLEDFGLAAAVGWYGDLFSSRTGIAVTVDVGRFVSRLPASIEASWFRILQESLTNVAKHANASEVTLTIEEMDSRVRMTIGDNGEGFDESSEDNAPGKKGWGLAMMAERAYKAGSTFSISSESGGGTRVVVEVAR